MPRKYSRKTTLRTEEASKALASLIKYKADSDGLPKSKPGLFREAQPPWLEQSTSNLGEWLSELETENDSFTFSMLLQVWLHLNGITCPKSVFAVQLTSRRGRPLSDIGFRAKWLHDHGLGWHKIAKRLVKERCENNADDAAKYVKDLATSAANAPNHEGAFEKAIDSGSFLLGIKKVKEQVEEAYRELEASELENS
jgi:hypothetical protein